MQNNILKYVMVFLTMCLAHVSAFAQEEITDSVSANLIVEEELSVSPEVDNSAIYKEVAPLSQQITDYKKTKEWKRSNIFMGCAIGSLALGVTIFTYSSLVLTNTDAGPLLGVYLGGIIGGPLMLASVPLFILAHKNKEKAKKSVTNVGVGAITAPMSGNKREVMPALTFSLSF